MSTQNALFFRKSSIFDPEALLSLKTPCFPPFLNHILTFPPDKNVSFEFFFEKNFDFFQSVRLIFSVANRFERAEKRILPFQTGNDFVLGLPSLRFHERFARGRRRTRTISIEYRSGLLSFSEEFFPCFGSFDRSAKEISSLVRSLRRILYRKTKRTSLEDFVRLCES